MSNSDDKSLCPNCNAPLARAPKRKARCPHCGQHIYVRGGKLLSEDAAQTEDWLRYLDQFGVTRRRFTLARNRLSERFGTRASVGDTVWSILNEQVAKARNLDTVKWAYYEMERLAEQEGKDSTPYLESALRTELQVLQKDRVRFVRIENCDGHPDCFTCPECQKLHGKRLRIQKALREMPIPRSCTSQSGCRCSYVPG